jgi:hypothetical protein
MDGAQYWKPGAKPADYMAAADGLRPNEKTKPAGEMVTMLDHGTAFAPLPPRSIWIEGEWLADASAATDEDYRTWVVSGEGTPGNFKTRKYIVPEQVAADVNPKHPADWSLALKKSPTTQMQTTKTTVSKAPSLPVGIRFRCPGCGHWYREIDLAGHAKVCPGKEEGESDWAISCECCISLDDTAKAKQGFPRPKPKVEAKKEVKKDGGGTQAA